MPDPRNDVLAKQLVDYSLELQPGERLYLEVKGRDALELAEAVIRRATERGGVPLLVYHDEGTLVGFWSQASEEQIRSYAEAHLDWMRRADTFLSIRGSDNPFDLSDLTPEQHRRMGQLFTTPVHMEQRLNHTRWCVLRYPNAAMAVLAKRPQRAFTDFYYDVCCLDYRRLSRAMDPLKALLDEAREVHIEGPGTDLRFSIEGLPAVKCDGHRNIPDGEIYTAPVRDSVEGTITYNTPSMQQGTLFDGVRLTFENGRIVEATCRVGDAEKLRAIFAQDDGAAYVGEFAFGLNPHIREAQQDILFDEKIAGSIHLTPGNAYATADNGNRSDLHWDLVLIQTPEHGGGTIWIDGVEVRRDGHFLPEALRGLNPENLLG